MGSKKHDSVLCLDIGGDSLKVAEFTFSAEGAVMLQRFAFQEIDMGDISTEDPQFIETINDKIKTLILSEGFRTKDVNVSISGQNAFIRFVKIPAMTDDLDKIQQILDFEARQNLPFPVDDVVYSSQLLQAEEDDELDAMFVVTKKSEVQHVIHNLEFLQKRVNIVDISPTAIFNTAHFNGIGEKQCEMILNIGGRCSSLIFVDNGRYFIRTFLTAGHTITQQIAKEFDISYHDAEEMKRRHGFVGLGGAYEEPESEVAATISKIIRNVMTRLHGEIFRTINVYRTQQKGRKPEKLYLTGGSSVMAYTPRFFEEKLRIPVEYLNPFGAVGVAADVDREKLASVAHLFPEVVGLAMRNAFNCPINVALVPQERKKIEDFRKKIPCFYASCFLLIFCLAVTFWMFSNRWGREAELTLQATNIWDADSKIKDNIQQFYKLLTESKNGYKEASAFFENSEKWPCIINAVQKITPDNIWYTGIYATNTENKGPQDTSAQQAAKDGGFQGFDAIGDSSAAVEKRDNSDLPWLVLEGHILLRDKKMNPAQIYEKLKTDLSRLVLEPKLVNSAEKNNTEMLLFEEFSEKDKRAMDKDFIVPKDGSNICTFRIQAKLKKPIKR